MHIVQPLGDGFRGRRHAAAAGFLMQMRHAGTVGMDQLSMMPNFLLGSSSTAPAPSPNRTQVARSV